MASSLAVTTVTAFLTRTTTRTVTSASATSTSRAPPQGGILEGANPTHWDKNNPIILFIIQAGIIIIFCRLLHWPLSKLRQPRVIAEVIGGILLGPSVMGRIPGFTDTIFPVDSKPVLSNVANLGLILFLFLVGLECDLRFLVSNWKIALSVGLGGMALPFGLGCAIAWGLYHQFHNEPGLAPISFGVYMLFVGVAMAITAFPVLCRILTELKLLHTPVGIIVLSAGVGNDVVGWILLALCVALVNAGTGLTALYVLLVALGYVLFLCYIVRPLIMRYLVWTRSLQDGPSQTVIGMILLLALTSSFFTGVIGVHPIFGAFLAGLILPHDGGFAIKVAEKLEDVVSTLFLPLYFALSGLSTNLGLLDSGITWAYVFGVIFTAFFAKVIGGSGAARLNGLVWRECFTIGALMSCKGLVELIVLNIGLQAKILSHRTFTIFVVMALVTTFATTPIVSALYPPAYQRKLEAWKRGEIDWATGEPIQRRESAPDSPTKSSEISFTNIMMYLRLDAFPTLMSLTSFLGGANQHTPNRPLTSLTALRLIPLTERDSSVMRVADVSVAAADSVLSALRTFASLVHVPFSRQSTTSIVPEASFAETLSAAATSSGTDLLIIPWANAASLNDTASLPTPLPTLRERITQEPFSSLATELLEHATTPHLAFLIAATPADDPTDELPTDYSLASTLSRTVSMTPTTSPRVPRDVATRLVVPFTGSADDKVALAFALRLVADPRVSATVILVRPADAEPDFGSETDGEGASSTHSGRPQPSRGRVGAAVAATIGVNVGSHSKTTARTTAIPLRDRADAHLHAMRTALSQDAQRRVSVLRETCAHGDESAAAAGAARRMLEKLPGNGDADFVVMGRNSGDGLGDGAREVVGAGVQGGLVVVRAGTGVAR